MLTLLARAEKRSFRHMRYEIDPETLSRNLRSRTKLFNALEKSAVHTLKKETLRIKGRGYCDVERASKVSRIDAPILFFFLSRLF